MNADYQDFRTKSEVKRKANNNNPDLQAIKRRGFAILISEKDLYVARKLRERISQKMKIYGLWVFGSRVRGDNEEDSDLDVLVEIEELSPGIQKTLSRISWEIGFDNDIVISAIPVSRKELENGPMASL